ncbi:MAG: hypothetical protein KatS3mg009_2916 [Acidimicrobiia bacterium]|nr:MAG: hypothetical protein KatS3mg009_2916 [Acidimicrobiia bacterium]
MATKYVYAFEEGSKEQKYLLGGKGANLAEMTNLGLPVPPGFTITTDACKAYMAAGNRLPDGLMDEVAAARAALEEKMGKRLGDAVDPLLVSVRSGAPFSMPGMMDTVLNLGLNDDSVKGLAKQTANERFAYDSYRRFVQMFGKIVLDVPGDAFEEALHDLVEHRGVKNETELSAEDLAGLVETFKGIVSGRPASTSRRTRPSSSATRSRPCSARGTVGALATTAGSRASPTTSGPRSTSRRWCSATRATTRGTGVAFTRNPSTGENVPYGDFLANAQGEDVVAGIRITEPLDAMGAHFPECHRQLLDVHEAARERTTATCATSSSRSSRGACSSCRPGSASAPRPRPCAWRWRWSEEGLIDRREAVLRVQPAQLDQLLHPQFDPKASYTVLAKGLNASPGAAVGKVSSPPTTPRRRAAAGERVILVRPETSPRRPPRHDRRAGDPHRRAAGSSRTPRSSRAGWASPRSAVPRPSRST